MVGTLELRKGHDVLLRACTGLDVDIVFAGPTVGREGELRRLAAELGLGERLSILGRVPDDVLARLYRDATVLAMPSFGEGFGLPVLEAMAAGAPVVASDLPAIREVAGDGAVLVPPGDVAALATALAQAFTDEALRSRLRASALERARAFSWERAAEATVQAYRSALVAPPAGAPRPALAPAR
jgi:glycosyltransferase involved in cell wall biosynthesis